MKKQLIDCAMGTIPVDLIISNVNVFHLTDGSVETCDIAVTEGRIVPEWLSANHDALSGTVLAKPTRAQIDIPVEETLIVELYSK